MSIDTLMLNPVIINELKTIFGGTGPGTGNMSYLNNFTGQQTTATADNIVVFSQTIDGLSIGAKTVLSITFSFTQTVGTGTNIAQFQVDSIPILSSISATGPIGTQIIKSGSYSFVNTATSHLFQVLIGGLSSTNTYSINSGHDYMTCLVFQVLNQ